MTQHLVKVRPSPCFPNYGQNIANISLLEVDSQMLTHQKWCALHNLHLLTPVHTNVHFNLAYRRGFIVGCGLFFFFFSAFQNFVLFADLKSFSKEKSNDFSLYFQGCLHAKSSPWLFLTEHWFSFHLQSKTTPFTSVTSCRAGKCTGW